MDKIDIIDIYAEIKKYPHVFSGVIEKNQQLITVPLEKILEDLKNARKHEEYYFNIIQDIDLFYENIEDKNYKPTTFIDPMINYRGKRVIILGDYYKVPNPHFW